MHNTAFGFCGWDLPAAIILIAVIIIFIIRDRKLKKQVNELEDELKDLKSENEVETAGGR